MTRPFDILYQVQLAVLNVEQAIEQHADLSLAQIQVEAHRASLHIHRMIEQYKAEDVFNNRSRGQKRRWFHIKQGGSK